MKKITITIFLIMIISLSLHAGNITDIGMKIGYSSSVFSGKELPGKGVKHVPGFTIGGFATYGLNRNLSIQPELFLATKGSKINTVGDIEQYNIFVYVEMPILAKYFLVNNSKFHLSGVLGPYFSMKALAMNDVGVLDNIRGFDSGIVAGVEVGIGRFAFEIRYEQGLVNFDTNTDDADLKNQTLSFIINIAFIYAGGKS